MATFDDPRDITVLFTSLGSDMQAVTDIIGTKDDKDSLIYNLGEACENQCENV